MTEDVAKVVIIAGSLLGIFIWILGIRLYIKMKLLPQRLTERKTINGKSNKEAMRILLKETVKTMGISEKTDDGFTLQLPLSRLRIRVEPESGGTSLNMEMDFTRLWRVMGTIMAVLVLFLEPVVIIGIFLLLWFFVAPNDNPGVRWQAVQVGQISHVLWPPFLVYFLFIKFRGVVKNLSDNLPILIEVSE